MRRPARPKSAPPTGEYLFWDCQDLATKRYPPTSGRHKLPSGARIFYFAYKALLHENPQAVIELNETPVPEAVAQRFKELARRVASRLAVDYVVALDLLNPEKTDQTLQRILRNHRLLKAPRLR